MIDEQSKKRLLALVEHWRQESVDWKQEYDSQECRKYKKYHERAGAYSCVYERCADQLQAMIDGRAVLDSRGVIEGL